MTVEKTSNSLTVEIITPNNIVLKEDVYSVSSLNEEGMYDILPLHENFITILREKIKIFYVNGKVEDLEVKEGVQRVRNGKVEIFVGLQYTQAQTKSGENS